MDGFRERMTRGSVFFSWSVLFATCWPSGGLIQQLFGPFFGGVLLWLWSAARNAALVLVWSAAIPSPLLFLVLVWSAAIPSPLLFFGLSLFI